MKITLTKAIEHGGKKITELDLNFEKLSGRDLAEAAKEARLMGDMAPKQDFTCEYLSAVAAKAAGVAADTILELPSLDFMRVKAEVEAFLYGWALPTVGKA